MEDISIFPDKAAKPTEQGLEENLGCSYEIWKQIHDFVFEQYPNGIAEWNFPGKKYGWNYRIKDKKRAIIYLLPREGFFKAALIFGDKAVAKVMDSDISQPIKDALISARKYAEGRGIGLEIKDHSLVADIEKLVLIKLGKC